MNTIYIGFDQREKEMGQMLEYSIHKHASEQINIQYIDKHKLKRQHIYKRNEKNEHHSTDFSMTRFLTPYLSKFRGWVLFQDIDMLWLNDPNELFNNYNDEKISVYCVHHDEYTSSVKTKMDGRQQQNFPKKNYSSLMLFNSQHSHCKRLMPTAINEKSPAYLHQFQWTDDSKIGYLPKEYNWLAGEKNYMEENSSIKNLHFTLFHPGLAKNAQDLQNINCPFAPIWYQYYRETFGYDHKYYSIYTDISSYKEEFQETELDSETEEIEEPTPIFESEEDNEQPSNESNESSSVFLSARTKFIRRNYDSQND